MALSEDSVTIWDKAWYKARGRLPFSSFALTNVFSVFGMAAGLVNGISSFIGFLYTAFPPVVERIADGFISVSNFIDGAFTTSGTAMVDKAQSVVTDIESTQIIGDGGSTFWEIVKYLFNVDALSDFLNFIVSIGWLWLFLLVVVLVVCTGLLVAGTVIFVTRRFVVFVSAGVVHYQ